MQSVKLLNLAVVPIIAIALLCSAGCTKWGRYTPLKSVKSSDADIHAKAKKDPFPTANEPAVENIRR